MTWLSRDNLPNGTCSDEAHSNSAEASDAGTQVGVERHRS
ncbi:hypothetical protein ACVIWV_006479 [Bradyrhizobium diazoefficiens]|jgi:hypothetical protein|uniref:Uncharacterized protein n=4 Tax=Bradyrhizobium TaxID=374 RepID=A0ABV4FW54_9BRAD|nr:hypothetical protein [Bradyrhizobium japonicum]MCS3899492.1 hypothetical protein [Bradyrhizobium japonicum USDA 38]MCS3933136.1 hypothetical protein [Bradyrhizobium elkanii]TWH92867.1 hypothetical protein IQ17_07103 [Bradyrhizobium daqingense]TWI61009.1 hypothetical protein IQ16_07361 [Bradyrhizobium huanghuaihaiense]